MDLASPNKSSRLSHTFLRSLSLSSPSAFLFVFDLTPVLVLGRIVTYHTPILPMWRPFHSCDFLSVVQKGLTPHD